MQTSRNPANSRPLSANVKRLMRLARASPKNNSVIMLQREFTAREYAYCHKQGNLFMEAASMGIDMEEFAPLFMTSQLAGVFDVSFSAACGIENDELSNLLRIPISRLYSLTLSFLLTRLLRGVTCFEWLPYA